MTMPPDTDEFERALRQPAALPDLHLPQETAVPPDPLAELYRLLQEPPQTPKIGIEAAKAMAHCLDTVTADVMHIVTDNLDRAHALLKEAEGFVTVINESKRVLCERIETEALRSYQVSTAIRETRRLISAGTRSV